LTAQVVDGLLHYTMSVPARRARAAGTEE
jgi:hypothetical protein